MAGTDGPDGNGEHAADAPGDDITTLREELFAARRQALVGRLAGALAHDFNNLLTAVIGYSEMLLADAGPGHPWRADLEEIFVSGQRAAQLTRRLLAFNRQVGPSPQLLSWSRLIEEMEPLLRPLVGERIELSLESDRAGPDLEVLLDKGEASEILFTLAWLARTCAASGGAFRLGVSGPRAVAEAAAGAGARAAQGAGAEAAQGPHASQEVRCGVLSSNEAGFAEDAASALDSGLRHVETIVGRAGGTFSCERTPGAWTVTFSFPVESGLEAGIAPVTQPRRSSPLTVLLAEDEELLRHVVRRMLERSGITVIDAASGEDALARLQHGVPQVDLLVTDVVLSGMSGQDLARRVAALAPDVRVLYVSGYTDASTIDLRGPGVRSGFLAKPFTREQLLGAIDGLMG
jgi:two-component system cell cycle sensor histidine kinase/response regulator CckA